MEYKIGEVSKILNVSKEMIRYYEKKGALTPHRKDENNYRTYSTMDIFLLMEIVRYQTMNFSVKDISELLSDNYMKKYARHLQQYYIDIDQEISYKTLLKQRIKELADRAEASFQNIGNYWIKKIPAHYLMFLVNGHGDQYERIAISNKNRDIIFKESYMSFFESIVIFEENEDKWWYGIPKDYYQQLSLNIEDPRVIDSTFCLCTMIDMGEVGEFNRDCLKPIYQYIEDKGYKVNGTVRGIIVGRGFEQSHFQRIMEIQIPIEL